MDDEEMERIDAEEFEVFLSNYLKGGEDVLEWLDAYAQASQAYSSVWLEEQAIRDCEAKLARRPVADVSLEEPRGEPERKGLTSGSRRCILRRLARGAARCIGCECAGASPP